jgi:hypothetical protein
MVDTTVPEIWQIQGAKLNTVTQQLAYKTLKQMPKTSTGTKAQGNIAEAMSALKEDSQIHGKTQREIWQDIWAKQSRKNVSQFLYKAMHGAQKIGKYWKNIEGAEDRASCTICGATEESMKHILLDCPTTVRKETWKMAKRMWPSGYQEWRTISMGLILGSGSIDLKPDPQMATSQASAKSARQKAKGRSELMQDLIRESAHLIWVMRCELVVGDRREQAGKSEVRNRWYKKIEDKLLSERAVASHPNTKEKTKRRLISKWGDVVEVDNGNRPIEGWPTTKGFLVGVRRHRPTRPVSGDLQRPRKVRAEGIATNPGLALQMCPQDAHAITALLTPCNHLTMHVLLVK